jgi:hypothetical protein
MSGALDFLLDLMGEWVWAWFSGFFLVAFLVVVTVARRIMK